MLPLIALYVWCVLSASDQVIRTVAIDEQSCLSLHYSIQLIRSPIVHSPENLFEFSTHKGRWLKMTSGSCRGSIPDGPGEGEPSSGGAGGDCDNDLLALSLSISMRKQFHSLKGRQQRHRQVQWIATDRLIIQHSDCKNVYQINKKHPHNLIFTVDWQPQIVSWFRWKQTKSVSHDRVKEPQYYFRLQ